MKSNSQYVKCPRCELNYIPKGEELCDVCKAELKLIQRTPLIPDEEDEMLCPYCKENYISIDDEMCLKCMERFGEQDKAAVDVEEDEAEWDEYIDDKLPEEDDIVSLTGLEEEENAMFDEEEEGYDDGGYPADDFEDEEFEEDEDFDDDFDDDEEDEDEDEDDEDY